MKDVWNRKDEVLNHAIVSSAKGAVEGLTLALAAEYAPNIRVNGISPGPTLKNKRQSERHFKKQWKSIILRKKVMLW